MDLIKRSLSAFLALLMAAGCASVSFKSVWRAHDAGPFELTDKRIAVFILTDSEALRRNGEEVTREVAQGVAGYSIISYDHKEDMERILALAREAGCEGVFVIRYAAAEADRHVRSGFRVGLGYGRFMGWRVGYYDPMFEMQEPGSLIETRLYDAKSGKILWTALSEFGYPSLSERVFLSVARESLKKMFNEGVLTR